MNDAAAHITPSFLKILDCREPKQLFDVLQSFHSSTHQTLFRGCGNAGYDLLPSALRDEGFSKLKTIYESLPPFHKNFTIDNDSRRAIIEYVSLSHFYRVSNLQGLHLPLVKQEIHEFMVNGATQAGALIKLESDLFGQIKWPLGNFEQALGLAQHYGLPTRLLDWSDDMMVAVYFAAKSGINHLKRSNHSTNKLAIWVVSRVQINTLSMEDMETNHLPFRIKLVDVPFAGNPNLAAQRGLFSLVVPKRSDPHQLTAATDYSVVAALNAIDLKLSKKFREFAFGDLGVPLLVKLTLLVQKSKELMKLLHGRGYDFARLFPGFAGSVGSIEELLDLNG